MKDKANQSIGAGLTFDVLEAIRAVLPGYEGCTLGGSRAQRLDDDESDVEMYFYTSEGPPQLDELTEVLLSVGATHRRSSEFLWDKPPWGPHSFFMFKGMYWEVGYRNLEYTEQRVKSYLDGNVAPEPDCHDLGQGYLPSGLAASIVAEYTLEDCSGAIERLKSYAGEFPERLRRALLREYLDTARYLVEHKLESAVARSDYLYFQVIEARVVRCLVVSAFALDSKHYPGDKWNEQILMRSGWKPAREFLRHLRMAAGVPGVEREALASRSSHIRDALAVIERADRL